MAVAEFSLSEVSYFGNDDDGNTSICVELLGRLGRNVSLQLSMENSTSDFTNFNNTHPLMYAFHPDADDPVGALCRTIKIRSDGTVENEEVFVISLQQILVEDDVNISRHQAEIVIEDSLLDSKKYCCVVRLYSIRMGKEGGGEWRRKGGMKLLFWHAVYQWIIISSAITLDRRILVQH